MGDTTTYTDLRRITPWSETHWREIAARAHETVIHEIRANAVAGSSRRVRYCPRCLERGVRYILIFMGGVDRCGTCNWPAGTK